MCVTRPQSVKWDDMNKTFIHKSCGLVWDVIQRRGRVNAGNFVFQNWWGEFLDQLIHSQVSKDYSQRSWSI